MRKDTTLIIFLLLFVTIIVNVQCKKHNDQPAPPPPPAMPGAIKGIVSNEYNQLLPGAVLKINGNGVNTSITATNGNYIVDSLQPGSYSLSIKKDGYIETSASVSITPGDTTTENFVLKAGTAYLRLLSDTIVVARPYAGTFTVKVESNTRWTINTASSWITAVKLNSNGDDSVMVRITTSTLDSTRQGNIVLQAGSIVKNIIIKQMPDVKLKQTIVLPGNQALGISDSIALVFNQPVTIKTIFPGNAFCQSEIRFSYTGNKVAFSYACAALGGDYPFTITTNSSLGDQYTFNFSAGFYEKIINLTGTIQSSFVNDADNSYWVITDHPNALYKIDMTTFNILHKYDLRAEPTTFTVSPYNNKIYLAYRGIPKLYILNQDGTTNKVVDIPHDTTRGLDGPFIYPSKVAFTKTGKGMIWLNDMYGNGDPYFWFIDATANHRIWYQSLPGYIEGNYFDPKANYDKTKLLLNSVNGDATIGIFDLQQMAFSSYKAKRNDIGNFVTPSRKNGNIYVGQLYFQSIANPSTGFESMALNKDNRNGGNIDFCYKPARDLTVYFTEGGYMQVIDYATGKTPVKYDAIYYLQGTTATLDGKYVLAYRHDGNYNAKVIQLPASWFNY